MMSMLVNLGRYWYQADALAEKSISRWDAIEDALIADVLRCWDALTLQIYPCFEYFIQLHDACHPDMRQLLWRWRLQYMITLLKYYSLYISNGMMQCGYRQRVTLNRRVTLYLRKMCYSFLSQKELILLVSKWMFNVFWKDKCSQ